MPLFSDIRRNLARNAWFLAFGAGVLCFTLSLGLGFYLHTRNVMELQLKERLRDTAAMGALQFDAAMIERVRGTDSLTSQDLASLVARLRAVRETMPDIRYAYIMRRTEEPNQLEFVADADSLSTQEELDTNGNGTLDDDELPSYPGDLYDASDLPALRDSAFLRPSVDEELTADPWGLLISGYAPIRDAEGKAVAVFGIDMNAAEYLRYTRTVFSPVVYLLVFVSALLFAAYLVIYIRNRRLEMLGNIDRERSGLMLLASHQLGEPLTIFQWTLEAMRESREKGTMPEDFNDQAVNMEQGLARMHRILFELREASIAEQGAIVLKPEEGYLRDTIVEVVRKKGDDLRQRSLTIDMDLDGNLRLSYDKRLIGEVLHELLDNAISFSRPGGTITVTATKRRGMAQVEVADSGCGIPKEDQPRIFGKFVRASNARFSRPDGNGLGLFIVKAIVEKAGGEIWFESSPDGTVFTFTLPLSNS